MVHVVGELRDKHQSQVSQLLGTRGPEVVGNVGQIDVERCTAGLRQQDRDENDPAQYEENMLRGQPKRKPMGRVLVRRILQLDGSRLHKITHFGGRERSVSSGDSDRQCTAIVTLLAITLSAGKRAQPGFRLGRASSLWPEIILMTLGNERRKRPAHGDVLVQPRNRCSLPGCRQPAEHIIQQHFSGCPPSQATDVCVP